MTDLAPGGSAPMAVDDREAPRPESVTTAMPPGDHRKPWAAVLEVAGVVALGALVFVVHPVGYLVHRPYWADESWVAVLSRAPLRQWVSLSSATPLGWLLVVRWAPVGRGSLRLVPLVFSGGSVVMAYVVARTLPWRTRRVARFAGAVAALMVLLVPIALVRNDLKQYTSDAFFSLSVLALTSRFEGDRSRRNLVVLAIGSIVAISFSTATAFVVVAAFASLAIVALASRSFAQVRDVVIAGAVVAGMLLVYVATVILPQDNQALRDYWRSSYLPERGLAVIGQVWKRLGDRAPVLAMHAAIFLALLVVGVVFIARLKRPAFALAVPLLWAEFVAAGVARRYPVLDQRTSHFLLIVSITVVAIGVAGAVTALARRSRVVAAIVFAVAAVAFLNGVTPYYRMHTIVDEDVRSQDEYVARHYRPGDVVLVNWQSDYAFTYYWPGGHVGYEVDNTGDNTTGFFTRLTNVPNVVYLRGRTVADTLPATRHAIALSRRPGATGRIWLIRSHVTDQERDAWDATFATLGLHPTVLPVGKGPLALVRSSRATVPR